MIEYKLIRSKRRTIAIYITPDGDVVVRAPKRCPLEQIEYFINEKESWIYEKQREVYLKQEKTRSLRESLPELTSKDYRKLREKARQILTQRVEFYAEQMQVSYAQITIRDQKTRWGSCSTKGNLNFNWRLILAPKEVLDYVVIHELTHRKYMNHSAMFWAEVEHWCPRYKEYLRWLKVNGDLLMSM